MASAQDEESVGASNVSSTSTSATGTKTKKFTKDLVPDRCVLTFNCLQMINVVVDGCDEQILV